MKTFQDFQSAVEKGRLLTFIRDAIQDHRDSDAFETAEIADEYDRQQNTTINNITRKIYNLNGTPVEDFTASNNQIASNIFHRLISQRTSYSLGNGVTFDTEGVKEQLGDKFDTDLFNLARLALKHGVSFAFLNIDRLHVFPLTEFVPLVDETDGSLRAGIRYWSIDWKQKPVFAVLYEEDGYTKYRSKGKSGLTLEEMEPKRAYKLTIAHTEAGGDEIIGEENYSGLPIVPLYANSEHQSAIVGMRAAIDAMDIAQSGYANDMTDCAQLYWLIGNAGGMTREDIQRFLDQIRLGHAAVVDTENSTVTPYTQEPPYNAREAFLNRIRASIYRDFGALNPEDVAAGQVTATQIKAAYQAQDEEADAFEYQIIETVQIILRLKGLEGTPQFKRSRVANELEQVQMVIAEAPYLDDETTLSLLPNITPEKIPDILAARDAQNNERFDEDTVMEAMNQVVQQQEPPIGG